jgi:hypothetical protein
VARARRDPVEIAGPARHDTWSAGASTSPLAADVSAQPLATQKRFPGLVTPIGWTYVLLGSAMCAAAFFEVAIGPLHLRPIDALSPALLTLAGIGAILRLRWGRWLAYAMSALILLGVPIGTVLGALMIHHLTIYKDQFGEPSTANNRWRGP